ncbi:MAG: type II toxin-antitoxin system RelE/ParE family toxin [Hyphomicrobiales bacterium]
MKGLPRPARALRWIGSSRRDYREFPAQVQDQFGFGLFLAQTGQHPPSAKAMKGFGPGVVELLDDHDGDAYRAVYTVRLNTAVYVLHAFKKKSKRGIATAQTDVELIRRRLRDAEIDSDSHLRKDEKR